MRPIKGQLKGVNKGRDHLYTGVGAGGGGEYSTNVYTGKLSLEVQPLTVFQPFFTEKVSLLYTVY